MASVAALLQEGLSHHQAGRLDQAERLYRQALASDPRDANVHFLLGMIELARANLVAALEHIKTAIEFNPACAEFHRHLGDAHLMSGQIALAEEAYRQAIRLDPRMAAAHNQLAAALRLIGNSAQAEASCREAIRLDPAMAAAHNNLGNVLQDQQRLDEAAAAFEQSARLAPDSVEILFNLGNCQQARGDTAAAFAAYRGAVALRGDFAAAHHQLGRLLRGQGRLAEAIAAQRQAISIVPEFVEAHVCLGIALQDAGQLDEAQACYRHALAIRPNDPVATYNLAAALHAARDMPAAQVTYERFVSLAPQDPQAHFSLGTCLQTQGKRDEAAACYRQAIALDANHAEAHYWLGTLLLAQGDFGAGWPEYEWRLKSKSVPPPHRQPAWRGEPLGGRRIIVFGDWGFGDTLHALRYVPMVQQRGGQVVLEVPKALFGLLRQSDFGELVPLGEDPAEPCDFAVSVQSLPGIFGTTADTIPAQVPYLKSDPALVESWRQRIAALPGYKIGICWCGSQDANTDRRSIPLSAFEPLVAIEGVQLVSLQKGDGIEQLAPLTDRWQIVEFGDELDSQGAFVDTAAIMHSLDLVISADTAIAHLAGALATPVWLALPLSSDWRWQLNRADSPWYPTMRLFRQQRLDDWSGPLGEMAIELARARQE